MTFEQRVAKVTPKGFTERQARFLVTVMLHSGVCMMRHYCAFGQMVWGQTVRDFFARLVAKKIASVCDGAHKRARIFHIHRRDLYAAIGEPHSRFRKPAPIGRAIERLMLLDAVLETRNLAWLASERDKLAHFTVLLGTQFRRDDLPRLTFTSKGQATVRHFPDKLPIGLDAGGRTHVFIYLVTRAEPVDFRAFLYRHAELLRALPSWTIRLVIPSHLAKAADTFTGACRQELSSPLRPAVLEEARWFFEQQRGAGVGSPQLVGRDAVRYRQLRIAFGGYRFRALYRSWLRDGGRALDAAASPVLAEAITRGTGRIECQPLPRAYLHLSPLVSTS